MKLEKEQIPKDIYIAGQFISEEERNPGIASIPQERTSLIKFINKKIQDGDIIISNSNGDDKNYVHIQSYPLSVWVINHNLDKYPSVTIIDSADSEVIGEIVYIDTNNLILNFNGSFSGKATLN
jgi:hypothetical protein